MFSGHVTPSPRTSTTVSWSDASQQARRRWSFLRSRWSWLWPLEHQEPVRCCSAPRTPTPSSFYRWILVLSFYGAGCSLYSHANDNLFFLLSSRGWPCVWMPCAMRSLRPTASSEPPSSSTLLLFASLRPAFPSDQTHPHQPPRATCLTSTPPQRPPSRYQRIGLVWRPLKHTAQDSSSWILYCRFSYFPFWFQLLSVITVRFSVRRTRSTCISCLRSKTPAWEH